MVGPLFSHQVGFWKKKVRKRKKKRILLNVSNFFRNL
jgi:hypothetical protein